MTFRTISSALALAALLSATPLAAQQTEQPAEQPVDQPTDQPAADAGNQTETDASTTEAPATEAPAAPAAPQVEVEKIGDWEVRCEVSSNNCFMYQLAKDQQGNPVTEINIVALPDGSDAAAGVTVVTPLGTLLSEGLVVQVDSNNARQYSYSWCTRSGCFARFGLSGEDVTLMKRGAVAKMRILSVSAPDQPVILDFSLSGFTNSFDRLKEKSK